MSKFSCVLLLSILVICVLPCEGVIPLSSLQEFHRQRSELALSRSNHTTPVSQQCRDAYDNLQIDKLVTVVDAAGKPGAGFTDGNVAWLGAFDLCRNVSGLQYCYTVIDVNLTLPGAANATTIPIQWGLCTVAECSDLDVANTLSCIYMIKHMLTVAAIAIKPSSIRNSAVHCAKDPPKPHSVGFYFTVTLCFVFAFLMLAGWLMDFYLRFAAKRKAGLPLTDKGDYIHNDSTADNAKLITGNSNASNGSAVHFASISHETNFIQEFFLCFALNRNLAMILNTTQPDKAIRSLHGIRFISMTWVILGHTFLWQTLFPLVNGLTGGGTIMKEFSFQVVNNAFFSVDTFFFLSGLLVAYLSMDTLEKSNGKLPWFKFYFHRYWRLTPTVAMTILIWMFIQPWMGQGPLWHNMLPKPNCEKYWWSTLLYINNFVPNTLTGECIGWTWYLANDWQFYVISPLILIPLFWSKIVGFVITSILLCASFITTGVLMGVYDFKVDFLQQANDGANALHPGETAPTYSDYIYIKPYCRIAPYLVGIVMGYALQQIRSKKIQVVISPIYGALGWAVATVIGMSVVYGLYGTAHGHELTAAGNITYAVFSRFAWGLALAWVVFACQFGLGGAINDFLSWSAFVPLSRLTFTAYLLHPIILDIFIFQNATPTHFSTILCAFNFVGVAAISYGAGLALSMAVEYPTANLEKLFLKRLSCHCCTRPKDYDDVHIVGSVQK
ncbi:nose resistant to fluoxetine protein 6-like [Glandiceps talaboti]